MCRYELCKSLLLNTFSKLISLCSWTLLQLENHWTKSWNILNIFCWVWVKITQFGNSENKSKLCYFFSTITFPTQCLAPLDPCLSQRVSPYYSLILCLLLVFSPVKHHFEHTSHTAPKSNSLYFKLCVRRFLQLYKKG